MTPSALLTPRGPTDSSAQRGASSQVMRIRQALVWRGSWTILGASPFPNEQSIQWPFLGWTHIFYLGSSHSWIAELLQMALWAHIAVFMRLLLHLWVSYPVGSQGLKVSLVITTLTALLPLYKTFQTSRHLWEFHRLTTDSKMPFSTFIHSTGLQSHSHIKNNTQYDCKIHM